MGKSKNKSKNKNTKKSSYVPQPNYPKEMEPRVQALLDVMTGQKTMEQAAREVNLSRTRFTSLVHRSLEAMLTGLEPGQPGRPKKSEREVELEEETKKLQRENLKLRNRVETIDRLLGVASDMLKGRITTTERQTGAKPSRTTSPGGNDDDEPDPAGPAREALACVMRMRALGLRPDLAAAVAGISPATVRRWDLRGRRGQCLRKRRGPAVAPVATATARQVEQTVRDLEGLCGAGALARRCGVSRRKAAAIKHTTLTTMERERKAACTRVVVAEPGIIRGFDQMYVMTESGWRFPLFSADACVPFRTSVHVARAYVEPEVLSAIEKDLAQNGAPLVYRLDRHSTHRTEGVSRLLADWGTLLLHGPPRHPQYYGQHERLNRDHRHWLAAHRVSDDRALPAVCAAMCVAMNHTWPRRSLGWRTPAQAWAARKPITHIQRESFHAEVYDRVRRLERDHAMKPDLAMRLAIEQALTSCGYLRLERGIGVK